MSVKVLRSLVVGVQRKAVSVVCAAGQAAY
jgi:hypothetical protein